MPEFKAVETLKDRYSFGGDGENNTFVFNVRGQCCSLKSKGNQVKGRGGLFRFLRESPHLCDAGGREEVRNVSEESFSVLEDVFL